MISFILPFVKQQDARALPAYQTYLKDQKTWMYGRYTRHMHAFGHESDGIKLLRYILQFVDYQYLASQSNNYDRYTYHIRFIRKDLQEIFDRVRRGRGYYHLFFARGSTVTEEFLLPVEDINCILHLPLYTEDWNVWKHVRPLRFWANDSDELTTKIINDAVGYKFHQPSYCVELLDVVALVFKYFMWRKHQQAYEPAEELAQLAPQQLFLHKYVMCDTMWDLGDIWLIRQLNRVLEVDDERDLDKFESTSMTRDQQWGWISMSSRRGFDSLWRMTHMLNRNLRPEALFSSKILFSGSLNDRIWLTDRELQLPHLAQYEWMTFLRDKDMIKLFVRVWMSRPNLPTTQRIGIKLRREFRRELLRRPWLHCINTALKSSIEREMLEMLDLLSTIQYPGMLDD